jgi:hypothetical protein
MKSRINEQKYYSQYGPTCPELFIKKKLTMQCQESVQQNHFFCDNLFILNKLEASQPLHVGMK